MIYFNPFPRWSEKSLFAIGTVCFLLGSFFAFYTGFVFDGAVDIHSSHVSFLNSLLFNLINVTVVAILLYIAGLIVNNRTRFIDILNASLIYRIPVYITLGFLNIPLFKGATENILNKNGLQDLDATQLLVLLLVGVAGLLLLIWAIVLLVNGFKVAANAKKPWHFVLFSMALLLAEITTKFIFLKFIR